MNCFECRGGGWHDKVACSKTNKKRTSEYYSQFYFICSGNRRFLNSEAIELTSDIGKRTAAINSEPLETQFLFQRISIAVQRGNAVEFWNTFPNDNNFSNPWEPLHRTFNLISFFFKPTGLCWWAKKSYGNTKHNCTNNAQWNNFIVIRFSDE